MRDRGERLSDGEFELLCRLLRRYCEFNLDQHDHLVVDTTFGDVFISVTRKPPPASHLDGYTRLPG
ncbi:hypothetical protein [Herbihabitans rhizosphaerae]|nr:hypothetical protein [Herbihabitans rhizosphaerae]